MITIQQSTFFAVLKEEFVMPVFTYCDPTKSAVEFTWESFNLERRMSGWNNLSNAQRASCLFGLSGLSVIYRIGLKIPAALASVMNGLNWALTALVYGTVGPAQENQLYILLPYCLSVVGESQKLGRCRIWGNPHISQCFLSYHIRTCGGVILRPYLSNKR